MKRRLSRDALIHWRVHRIATRAQLDANSLDYLYLVQQAKRLALGEAIGRFSGSLFLLWPWRAPQVLIRWIDLALTNSMVTSMLNEKRLQDARRDEHGA